eukprot:m.22729 g.22729  ORF g.22729 m.22729 type:complete len:53 (-) comp8888_c1_seq1:619-777(-)
MENFMTRMYEMSSMVHKYNSSNNRSVCVILFHCTHNSVFATQFILLLFVFQH